MPDTFADYIKVLHEKDRAEFFGTVPNYIANLDIEIARLEADNPAFESNPAVEAQKASYRATNKFGVKQGSPFQEV